MDTRKRLRSSLVIRACAAGYILGLWTIGAVIVLVHS